MRDAGFDRRELLGRAGRLAVVSLAPGWVGARRPPLSALARSLRGDLVLPGTTAYASARLLHNTRFDGLRPLAVAFCEGAEDVAKVVHWARRNDVRVAARSGRHSYGGYSTTPGIVVDVSRMNGVRVNGRAVTVGAGAALVDVYGVLAPRGLAIPAGTCPTVGIAGLALGGGVGFTARKLGLTCDNVAGLTVVTAAGETLACDARHHADLYWACRGGGGGNFGIATSFSLRAHPVGTVSWFTIDWPWRDAEAALRAWQSWAPHAPDALFSVFLFAARGTKGAGVVPLASAGGQLLGSEQELRALIRPLLDAGAPARVSVRSGAYLDSVFHWAGCPSLTACRVPERETFAAKSDYVSRPLPTAGIRTMIRWIAARQADPALANGSILLDSYGGAINRVPSGATAFVHRDQLFSGQYLAYWTGTAAAAANLRWLRGFYRDMRPYVSGFAYQNYIDPDLASWRHAYYGSNLRRLVAVKRRYDPTGFFRFRQSL